MGISAGQTGSDNNEVNAVRVRLFEDYVAQLPSALGGSYGALALNLWYYSDSLPAAILYLWGAYMAIALAGYGVTIYLHKTNPEACLTPRFVVWMNSTAVLIGFGWGSLGAYAVTELTAMESFLGVTFAVGILGAAAATNSAFPVVWKALAFATLAPICSTMLVSEHSGYNVMGVALLIYLVVMLQALDQIHVTLHRSIELGIANAELIVSLEKQSNTDALTGLHNRRGLNGGFESAWGSALETGQSLGLVLCDVDYFKAYNDTLGHQAGDACLETIGAALQSEIRFKADMVARYGGEEFAILIKDSTPDLLGRVSERVRVLIQGLEIAHPASSVADHVTISVGASQLQPTHTNKVEELLNAADNALYASKAAGRNCVRVVVAEASTHCSYPPVVDSATLVDSREKTCLGNAAGGT